MDEFLKELTSPVDLTSEFPVVIVALTLALSFVLSLVIAWVYRYTHTGVSYSQSFAQTLVAARAGTNHVADVRVPPTMGDES